MNITIVAKCTLPIRVLNGPPDLTQKYSVSRAAVTAVTDAGVGISFGVAIGAGIDNTFSAQTVSSDFDIRKSVLNKRVSSS